MRYLSLAEVLELHLQIISQSGGSAGIRDLGSVESGVAQPQMMFNQQELYPTIESKAAAICFSLVLITLSLMEIRELVMLRWKPF